MSPPMSDTSTTASAPLDPRPCVIAIDAGTTGVRSRAVFTDAPSVSSYREFAQHYPEPGQVERDSTNGRSAWPPALVTVFTRLMCVALASSRPYRLCTLYSSDAL